ncbi:MFS transporter [bacterium]|nr:MFS transporter [bacterium]
MQYLNHKWWISLYLAAMFGGLGVQFIYLQIFLRDQGFSYETIGFLLAVIPAVALVTSPLWGIATDSSRDPRKILLLLLILAPASHYLLIFHKGIVGCLVVCVCIAIFYQPIVPIQDSLILRALHRYGGDYGRLRIWGSIGFTIPALILPVFWMKPELGRIDWTVPALVYGGYAIGSVLMWLRFPSVPPEKAHRFSIESFKLLKNRTFQILLTCVFLARLGSSGLEGYQTMYFEELGVPIHKLALFLSLGPLSEVATIFYSQRWMVRVGARKLMALCLGALVVRMAVTAFSKSWPVLIGIQSLHCLTFGTQHVVTILVVNQLAGDRIRSSAQTLLVVFTVYTSRLLGISLSGWIAQNWGIPRLFEIGAGIAALSFLLWWLYYEDTENTTLKDGMR